MSQTSARLHRAAALAVSGLLVMSLGVGPLAAPAQHAEPGGRQGSLAGACASGGRATTIIEWVPFIRFGGIMYLQSPMPSARALRAVALGPVFATVRCKLAGAVTDPTYRPKDGDAAFVAPGTPVFTVKGYRPTFRLAIRGARGIILFEADTNPRARRGADLLDIGGKVRAIGITAASGGTVELARITNPVQITRLVGLILRAPVDQKRPSLSPARYTLTFHLVDGTSVARSYWPDSGELSRGIMTSRAFAAAIKRAATAGRS